MTVECGYSYLTRLDADDDNDDSGRVSTVARLAPPNVVVTVNGMRIPGAPKSEARWLTPHRPEWI